MVPGYRNIDSSYLPRFSNLQIIKIRFYLSHYLLPNRVVYNIKYPFTWQLNLSLLFSVPYSSNKDFKFRKNLDLEEGG